MFIDLEVIHDQMLRIVQEYLLNVSSLRNHNYFSKGTRTLATRERGFPMLNGRNQYILDEESFLEGCTRAFLINPIMKSMLDMAQITNDWKYGNPSSSHILSNREYEYDAFVEFIFRFDGKNIGCRYSRASYRGHETWLMDRDNDYLFNGKKIPGFDHLDSVDEIWAIDWTDDSHVAKKCSRLIPGLINPCRTIEVSEFFERLFSKELFDMFVEVTRRAIDQAISLVALEAAPQLLPNNLLSFKELIMENFTEDRMRSFSYRFQKRRYVGLVPAFSKADRAAIEEAFFNKGYRYSLIGKSDFAQSFITSEYLYHTIKSGLSIDYTAVVVGYLKSVEQLLYIIYVSAFQGQNGMCYWDTCTKPKGRFDSALPNFRYDPYDQNGMQEMYFHWKKTGAEAPEIGTLTRFLRYFVSAWNISETGKEYVFACLDDFRAYCRNHHFHKDNIGHEQYERVEIIRNNTIVCLFYLIGSFRLLDESICPYEQLGIVKYDFESLYRSIWEKRHRLFYAQTTDGYAGIVYYLDLIAPTGFNESGQLKNDQLLFVKFPQMTQDNAHYDEIASLLCDAEYVRNHVFSVAHENMPTVMRPLMHPKR